MTPTDEQIAEFKHIYKQRFGYDLTSTEAKEHGMSLLRVVRFVYQSVTQAEIEALKWHKENNSLN